ncbi:MAG: peptidoglycan-binding protein [Clostridia bacterium]|nr:peptidoglycan-binding protein [Clostridia bacterium]
MSTGRLQVNVFDKTIGKPLGNVNVRIFRSNDNQNSIFELTTNSSGQSDTIELETPPVEYSLTPNSPMPYSEYTAEIIKENYEQISVEKIQILPNSLATQNVFLNPISPNSELPLEFIIPPHTLYGEYPPKIVENAIKELPNNSGLVVLDKVVVPEFIVVHDGDPNDDSAPNYWIPYKDYIKNVASCEIYATWPIESIKANILTINSFTLNRVYTEWYRSRGKNFTITSSTAYDQKFVYQRNIFQEISNIVDDFFATFITKPNIKQPLFTQYCDGKNVTCPNWLSQWGSKELAENGLGYIEILQNYYGSDIYLESTDQVTGIPVSFPGETLQIGSSGNAVRTIQSQLNAISDNYPLINKLAVDGVYGQSTADAVKQFQNIFGMPETGLVDYATWYEISKVYTAVKRL